MGEIPRSKNKLKYILLSALLANELRVKELRWTCGEGCGEESGNKTRLLERLYR